MTVSAGEERRELCDRPHGERAANVDERGEVALRQDEKRLRVSLVLQAERPDLRTERDSVAPERLARAQELGLVSLDVRPDEGDLVQRDAVARDDLLEAARARPLPRTASLRSPTSARDQDAGALPPRVERVDDDRGPLAAIGDAAPVADDPVLEPVGVDVLDEQLEEPRDRLDRDHPEPGLTRELQCRRTDVRPEIDDEIPARPEPAEAAHHPERCGTLRRLEVAVGEQGRGDGLVPGRERPQEAVASTHDPVGDMAPPCEPIQTPTAPTDERPRRWETPHDRTDETHADSTTIASDVVRRVERVGDAVHRAVRSAERAPHARRSIIRLSILITTLESRKALFDRLYAELARQVDAAATDGEVEILVERDAGQASTGAKRNLLLERAAGDFVVYVDDDDDVHERYVSLILDALRTGNELDSLGIEGEITFRGKRTERFVMSNRYREYAWTGERYVRPPHHLNPIRREIATRYRFEEADHHEDSDWAMRICRDRVLEREVMVEGVLYRYNARRSWLYQRLLDRTEFVRHPLGLKVSNRHRIKRALRI